MSLDSLAWLAVIPALGLLILVHELGHFLVALKMGIKVEEFGIGYPPRMLTLFERNGVKYTLNWLPLGGFVRMTGEEGNFAAEGSLAAAPPWKRIAVISAGVIMNMLTAMVLFAIIFAVWGKAEPVENQVVISAVQDAAETAGIEPGDRIVSMNNQPINSVEDVRPIVQNSIDKEITIVVEREGVLQTFKVKPQPLSTEPGGPPRLGIHYGPGVKVEHVNPLVAIWEGILESFRVLGRMVVGFGALLGGLFGLTQVPEGGIAGPVGIARITGEAARSGLRVYLSLTALLSVNLALINILPIPALDGSRIVFALIEWVRKGRRIAPEKEAFIHAIGMLVLLGLILLVTISDIGNAISGQPALP